MGFDEQRSNSRPWRVSDAPVKYIDLLKRQLLGLRSKLSRWREKSR
ncbi:hypothetical protein CTAM01_08761 [Colletotrichum tamarilloi]|uniref:Uncharacterized protein n=1 Tax=Colletotrichum tamarilloi TaxID=1209934 RepID=A0ABQ9R4V6_9PEZI|nr:uncharacterized protein CTAM01_08761 [Colletotrichum tamarilloi]KAK1494748.1 hypothetical protein CTAM01_08761 [Colletotrichum tamarilloi]